MNKGQRLEPYERSIEDKNQFAVWCLEHEKEVFINDVEQEYHQYIPSFREKILVKGETEMPQSLLYVPIQVQSRTLGVLSVQTPLKGAYTRYHLEMLRAIASYTASALNNAEAFGEIQRQQVLLSQQATDIELANTALQEAHEESETLLKNILPEEIALRLKFGERAIADHYDSVTVLFADIVGFTNLSAHVSAKALVEGLNRIFAQFDALTKEYGVEKIKTIGDAYMVAGGLPARTDDHCTKIASLALAMQNVIKGVVWTGNNGENIENKVQLRIGIHTGEAVAGVIGTSKFAYDLWGNTVNTASRMESHGEAGKIHISEEVYRALQEGHSSLGIGHSSNDNTLHQSSIDATYNINDQSTKTFLFEERGEIEVKGKGMMRTYFLTGVNDTKLS
jgi:class 3 adenylate cyclase